MIAQEVGYPYHWMWPKTNKWNKEQVWCIEVGFEVNALESCDYIRKLVDLFGSNRELNTTYHISSTAESLFCVEPLYQSHIYSFLKIINFLSPSLEIYFVRKIKSHTHSSKYYCRIYQLLSVEGAYFYWFTRRLSSLTIINERKGNPKFG